jgi:membrane-associated phospholipid phosphatase
MKNFDFIEKTNEVYEHFKDFFWGVGYFGWQISTLYALYVSYSLSYIHALVYSSVFLLSGWLNHIILKHYINDPRPKDSAAFLANEKIRFNDNGMPSGHSQMTAYSLTFAYLLSGKYFYESIALFFITIFQRYIYKNHTIPQLFVGGIIGLITAYLTKTFIIMISDKDKPISKANKINIRQN